MVKMITRDQLLEMVCSGRNVRIVDVLDRKFYAAEHIKSAISIPLDEIEQRAMQALNRNDTIVTYCASFECQASTKAAEKLSALGFSSVLDYKGGIKDWKEAGLPLEGSLHREASRGFPCPSMATS